MRPIARNDDASSLLESSLVAAVSSFLAVRFLLAVTHNAQIGGSGLHIAHMLPGGLLMLAALMLLMIYLDRWVHHVAAIIGGFGFGIFIDEIGKFVTADNDYFFRPAVALIYIVFVIVFLVGRTLVGRRRLSSAESLANALDLVESTIGHPIEPDDRARIDRLLDGADANEPLVGDVVRYLDRLPPKAEVTSRFERLLIGSSDAYGRLVSTTWFERALVVAVLAYAVAALVGVSAVVFGSLPGGRETSLVAPAQAVSTAIGAALIVRGALSLPISRVAAYGWFMRGLLVWILVSQIFVFYASQLAGLGGLAVDLIGYVSIRLALRYEQAAATPAAAQSEG